jgi:hypothetical protein
MQTTTAARKTARNDDRSTGTSRRYPPGSYLVTRDPSTAVGPTDILSWVVRIVDCPGGRGVIGGLYTVRGGDLGLCISPPRKWRTPRGAGLTDGQGEAYLEWLSSAQGTTVAPFVPPKPPTKDDVVRYIGSNSRTCYRDLVAGMATMLSRATPTIRKFAERQAIEARPGCGYDCDTCCPVSGRPST